MHRGGMRTWKTVCICSNYLGLILSCPQASGQVQPPAVELTSPFGTLLGRFGESIAGVGDVNGDGVDDFIVGAPGEHANGVDDSGRAYLYSGADMLGLAVLESQFPTVNGWFGKSVSGVPDANGDGRDDIIVGAPGEGAAGRIYVFAYHAPGNVPSILINSPPSVVAGAQFGWSLSGVEDMNGNARGDAIIGAPYDTHNSTSMAGRAYVISIPDGSVLMTLGSPAFEAGGNFGWAVSSIPDVDGYDNGDTVSRMDLVVGAPNEEVFNEDNAGRAYVFSGSTGMHLRTLMSSPDTVDTDNYFGFSVSGTPDLDNDGRGDIIVGSYKEEYLYGSPPNSGCAYVFSGKTGSRIRALYLDPALQKVNTYFGYSVSGIQDIDGDRLGDLIVGCPRYYPGYQSQQRGRVFVYSGASGTMLSSLNSHDPSGYMFARLGTSVSSTGCHVLAGAPQDYSPAPPAEGYAFLYTNTASPSGVYITEVDERELQNRSTHQTDNLRKHFALRRGDIFDVYVIVPVYPTGHHIEFEAQQDFDGGTTTIQIPVISPPLPDDWSCIQTGVTDLPNGSKRIEMRIKIPSNAPIGEYMFNTLMKFTANGAVVSSKYLSPIVILFNPWHSADGVYLEEPGEAKKSEYILRGKGILYSSGRRLNPATGEWEVVHARFDWDYDQFDKDGKSLDVVLDLLRGDNGNYSGTSLNSVGRADPVVVSRHLSIYTRASDNGDGPGICVAKWEKPYTGGTNPNSWKGTSQILHRFTLTGNPVKFGQCWVLGGITNTLLRCVGIPSRPITNYLSGEDDNHSKIIEFYRLPNGRIDRFNSEKVWNFHVWCDTWMKRPDRAPPHDGYAWQAVDGTYGAVGPAPLSAIKADAGGNHEVDFVFAEVDAPLYIYPSYGSSIPDRINTTYIGHYISTKAVGGTTRAFITDLYKIPEISDLNPPPGPPLLRGGPRLESGVELEFDPPEAVGIGSDIVWSITLENTSAQAKSVHIVISGDAITYRGTLISELSEQIDTTIDLDPGEVESVALVVPPSSYTAWTGTTETFEGSALVEVLGTTDVWCDIFRTLVGADSVLLTLTPDDWIHRGDTVTVDAEFSNPLSNALNNVTVELLNKSAFDHCTCETDPICGGRVIDRNFFDGPTVTNFLYPKLVTVQNGPCSSSPSQSPNEVLGMDNILAFLLRLMGRIFVPDHAKACFLFGCDDIHIPIAVQIQELDEVELRTTGPTDGMERPSIIGHRLLV